MFSKRCPLFQPGHAAQLHFPASFAGGGGLCSAEGYKVPFRHGPRLVTTHAGNTKRKAEAMEGRRPVDKGHPGESPWVSETCVFTELRHSHLGALVTAVVHPG